MIPHPVFLPRREARKLTRFMANNTVGLATPSLPSRSTPQEDRSSVR